MARRTRRSRTTRVVGRPNYLWINTAGSYVVVTGGTTWDAVIQPSDWSGTVTEQSCTLERIVLSAYTLTRDQESPPFAANTALVVGPASNTTGFDSLDISLTSEWPEFFEKFDDVLHIGRLEWNGDVNPVNLPLQFSQLPEPVANLKRRRRLQGDDAVWFCTGGSNPDIPGATWYVVWFARSLVRVGLK